MDDTIDEMQSLARAVDTYGITSFEPEMKEMVAMIRDAAILTLEHLDRPADALNYLRESIRLDPNQEQADLVRAQIARLEQMLGQR